ncbi:MAG: serine hydrolase [Pseudomonadota bacterium]
MQRNRIGKRLVKFAAGATFFVASALVGPQGVRAEVGAYLLFDMSDGTVIAKHRASTPWYPASLTKLMTAYVTFQSVEDGALKMTSPVKISAQARQQPPSKMGFPLGTVITVETALRIILTKSANDVSLALAEAVGGTSANFMAQMNDAAASLGMDSSYFDNPHGLPNAKQVTTARDMAVLMRALAEDFPNYADFFDMGGVRLGQRTLRNHNRLIRQFRGADGMKTGFICASGFNLAATATRGQVRLGAVVLGGVTSRERDERTAELLAKGFEAVENGGAVALNGFGKLHTPVALAPVVGRRSTRGKVKLLPAASEETVDLRPVVCGAKRRVTRYDAGVVADFDEFLKMRQAARGWEAERERRRRKQAEVLAAPRQVVVRRAKAELKPMMPAHGVLRALGEADLIPAGWSSDVAVVFPQKHPTRKTRPPVILAAAEFAPEDWIPSAMRPPPNPLTRAGLRNDLPPEPPRLPFSYLEPSVAKAPIPIKIGGADTARPKPLSGAVIGGGPPPLPRSRPELDLSPSDDGTEGSEPELALSQPAERPPQGTPTPPAQSAPERN